MDNKITKKRLYNVISYDWVKMILISLAGILLFSYIFSLTSVKLAPGQQFKYYIDQNLSTKDKTKGVSLNDLIMKDTFSDEVKDLGVETLLKENNVLNPRLSIGEGNVIFTDFIDEDKPRAKIITDVQEIYTLDKHLTDCQDYLAGFLKDEFNSLSLEEKRVKALTYDNLSVEKMEQDFLKTVSEIRYYRNGYRAGTITLDNQTKRIKKLCADATDYAKLFEKDENGNYVYEHLFFRYTRYEYSYNPTGVTDDNYKKSYEKEISEGRENLIYGLKLDGLKGGKHQTADFFRVGDREDSYGVVLQVFDFYELRKGLQFETISFVVKVVKTFSNILG